MAGKLVTISLCFILLAAPFVTGCNPDIAEGTPPADKPYDGMLSSSLNEDGLPLNDLREFPADTAAIYFTIWVALLCCDTCSVYWTYEGEIIDQDFIPKNDTDVYTGYFTASLARPENGFLAGNYSVYSSQSLEVTQFVITP